MKTLRNDTRYIIKKVIIGVLIAIVLFNARKCGVYAQTTDLFVSSVNRSPINAYMDTTNPSSYTGYYNGSFTLYFGSSYDTGANLTFNNNNYYLKTGFSSSTSSVQGTTRSFNHTIIFKSSDYIDTYLILDIHENNSQMTQSVTSGGYINIDNTGQGLNFQFYRKYENDYYLNTTATYTTKILSSSSSLLATIGSAATNGSTTSKQTNIFYNTGYSYTQPYGSAGVNHDVYCLSGSYNYPFDFTGFLNLYGFEYFYSSLEVDVKLNETLLEPVPQFPPSGYSELSLKDYQGAVFVPKNYDDINCELTSSGLCETFFEYYYDKEIKEAYFPLDNHFKITLNSDILNSSGEPTARVSEFPIYQLDENENKIYNAFLIYNFTNDGTPLDPNNYYAYGSAKVWYDSTKWDYYLVEDFSTWSQHICFYVGSTETCIDVSGLPTLREAIEEADQQALIDSFSPTSSNVILEFLKIPFTFLMGLSPDKCTSFDLPIPHIGTTRINCLSDTFHEVMGNSYNIVAIIFNGFLLYSFTLMNIKTFKECSDANDDKLEVVEL